MKTNIQAQIYSETQNMSPQEILDYFNKNKPSHLDTPAVKKRATHGGLTPFGESTCKTSTT
jgi:hypothetical protein